MSFVSILLASLIYGLFMRYLGYKRGLVKGINLCQNVIQEVYREKLGCTQSQEYLDHIKNRISKYEN